MSGCRSAPDNDQGSILVLTIFYAALCLLVVLVAISATSLYLDRKRLFTLADGAALAGAEAFALDAAVVTDHRIGVHLRDRDVAAAAASYLAAAPGSGTLENVTLESALTHDGQSATVTLSAWWRPPMLALLIPAGVPLEVETTARSVLLH